MGERRKDNFRVDPQKTSLGELAEKVSGEYGVQVNVFGGRSGKCALRITRDFSESGVVRLVRVNDY
jgi:hypothetical protein